MPQIGESVILSFIAFDAPVVQTAGVHAFSFVIDEDCRFTAIRVKGEEEDYADDEGVEGHVSSTHEQASGVLVHPVSDDDDEFSSIKRERHSGKHG